MSSGTSAVPRAVRITRATTGNLIQNHEAATAPARNLSGIRREMGGMEGRREGCNDTWGRNTTFAKRQPRWMAPECPRPTQGKERQTWTRECVLLSYCQLLCLPWRHARP